MSKKKRIAQYYNNIMFTPEVEYYMELEERYKRIHKYQKMWEDIEDVPQQILNQLFMPQHQFGKDLEKKLKEYAKNLKAKKKSPYQFGKELTKAMKKFKMPEKDKAKIVPVVTDKAKIVPIKKRTLKKTRILHTKP